MPWITPAPQAHCMAIREFSDYESISDYAVSAMSWAVSAGVLSGMGDGTIAPQGEATRAQFAVILSRVDQTMGKGEDQQPAPQPQKDDILIAYFSQTDTTQEIAEIIQEQTGGDMFRIQPLTPYPDSEEETSEIALKELEEDARPALSAAVENMNDYDTVFVGFPIWNGTTPAVVRTFLDVYEYEGKTIIPFATSGGSGISEAQAWIQAACGDAHVVDGLLVESRGEAAEKEIAQWLSELGIVD